MHIVALSRLRARAQKWEIYYHAGASRDDEERERERDRNAAPSRVYGRTLSFVIKRISA